MSSNVRIDAVDRRILGILQQDASLSVQTIADRVGLSTNPCWRRIRRLEREGVVQRRVALIDPAKVGLPALTFVSLRISRHDVEWLDRFIKAVQAIPEIVECHRMSGELDYLLKIVVRDIAHYDRVYQRLVAIPGLIDVSAAFSMERVKFNTAVDLSTA